MDRRTYQAQIYVIPENYNDAGKFGGLFGFRNLIEASLVIVPLALLELQLDIDLATKAILCTLTLIPISVLCLVGIGHYTLFQWIGYFLLFLIRPKNYQMKRIGRYLEDLLEEKEKAYGKKHTKKKNTTRTTAHKKHCQWHD